MLFSQRRVSEMRTIERMWEKKQAVIKGLQDEIAALKAAAAGQPTGDQSTESTA